MELASWISSRHNMGMTFARDLWNEIKKCAKVCTTDSTFLIWQVQKTMGVLSLFLIFYEYNIYTPLSEGEEGVLFYPCVSVCLSVCLSILNKFIKRFLNNFWSQMLDISSHSLFMYAMWWASFLDQSDINILVNDSYVYFQPKFLN